MQHTHFFFDIICKEKNEKKGREMWERKSEEKMELCKGAEKRKGKRKIEKKNGDKGGFVRLVSVFPFRFEFVLRKRKGC